MKKPLLALLIAATALSRFVAARPALAQDASPTPSAPAASASADATVPSDAELGESAAAVKGLRAVSPKTLVFVFDVSGSMRGELLRRAREAAISMIREGTQRGDRVVLFTFGADYKKVFDKRLANEAEKHDLIDLVPNKTGTGEGTNIRKPHHEALKLLEASLPEPGAVVLLTDSYNDQPGKNDPEFAMYKKYYIPGDRLTKYPKTPENADYERLLKTMTDSRKVQIFGIGVQIDKSGRPVEQMPKAEATPAPATDTGTGASTPVTSVGGDKKGGLPPEWLLGGMALLALALVAAVLLLRKGSKPVSLRIKGGANGAKDYEIAPGQAVTIGGPTAYAFDAYGLAGITNAVATLRGASGGRFTLSPVAREGAAPPVKVVLNGLPLEKESPLAFGDEVRVSAPDASGAIKEYRLIFDDPTKSF